MACAQLLCSWSFCIALNAPLFWGVDLFFVISGFLITGILLERKACGQSDFAYFYARRARRILPPFPVAARRVLTTFWYRMDGALALVRILCRKYRHDLRRHWPRI